MKLKMNQSFSVLLILVIFITNAQSVVVNVNTKKRFQTIDGFGASDAWRCQFVGKNWPVEKKENIAKLLFSKKNDKNGNPEGIGLSIWRFYIGAGTTEQAADSDINNEWRRAESFLDTNGNYDWTKQSGQQWFLKKAQSYGVDKFLAFSISAPVQWTLNGKGYNGDVKNLEINLQPDKFDDYAKFLVNVLKHFKKQDISFDYLSPVNEPQWGWETKTQEGTPATNENIVKFTNLLDDEIKNSNLPTQIVLAESADLRWLYSGYGKPTRGHQIDYFFKPLQRPIENLKNTISGHSYFTTWPVDSLIGIRQKLNRKLSSQNIDYWQSEFCILEKTGDIGGGQKRDLGMDTALYVARVIHADLTIANASSWQWWTALSNADFKDGLIYLDTGIEGDMYNLTSLKTDGNFHASKLMWGLGNYSRFVKPNMVRIETSINEEKTLTEQYSNVMISGYLDQKKSDITLVAINYSKEDKVIKLKGCTIKKMYTTSKDKNLSAVTLGKGDITIKARSINTLIGAIK